jgi:hypothetical protein
MIKRLAYRPPTSGTVASGYDPNLQQDKYRVDKHGNVYPIEDPKPDPNEGYTFLEVRETDLPDLHSALQWFTAQSEIPIPAVMSRDNGTVKVKVRGDFTPSLRVDDLSQIVADYRLLGSKFGSWGDVVRRPSRETEALESVVLALAEDNKEIDKRNGLLWAVRALEIRNEIWR